MLVSANMAKGLIQVLKNESIIVLKSHFSVISRYVLVSANMAKACRYRKNKQKKISRKIWNSTVSTNMLAMWLVWKESYQIPDIIHVVKLIMITPRAYPQPVWFWFLVMKLCLQFCAQFGAWFWELPRRCSKKLFLSMMDPHMKVHSYFISRWFFFFLFSSSKRYRW